MAWLVVGLGNPGPRYEGTRHSVGREVVRALASRLEASLDTSKFRALFGFARRGDDRVALALPLTYMNESGQAVGPLARYFKVPADRLIVVFDDLDLPVGRIRLRHEGGSGGNRGLASVIEALGTDTFPRLRIGIGRPPPGWEAADYVLAKFGRDERRHIDQVIETAADAILAAIDTGFESAMNRFN